MAEGADAVQRTHRRRLLLHDVLEGGPGPVAVLQRQDVQCVGEHEPARYPVAENFTRPSRRRNIARTYGAKERLCLVAVLPGLLWPQLVMKLLVHCSPIGPLSARPGREI
jgi:hypothetical protein